MPKSHHIVAAAVQVAVETGLAQILPEAAAFIDANVTKPMAAYIAGVTAPPGKKMGHAGAIVSGGKGTAQGKMLALSEAGVKVGVNPTEAGEMMTEIIRELS